MNAITVIGLGKLGTPMAAVFAAAGFHVWGVDTDKEKVSAIQQGVAPVDEPGVQMLISAHAGELFATHDTRHAVSQSDVTFVIVPTPTDESGGFSLRHIHAAVAEIGAALRHKSRYHLVVITSTVMPEHTRRFVIPALEAHSGKTCGEDFGVCYSPEFIALGNVVRGLTEPDMLLVGQYDDRAGEMLEAVYRATVRNNAPVHRMSLESAELCKLAVNGFVTMKISYANMLASICDTLPHAHIDDVTDAMARDYRIGGAALKAATAYGGPCFPRDNVALELAARLAGVDAALPRATDNTNNAQVARLVRTVLDYTLPDDTVAILGMAYKPGTGNDEHSASKALSNALQQANRQVIEYDPLLPSHANSAQAAVDNAQAVVVMLPLAEVASVTFDYEQVVIDMWRTVRDTDALLVQPGVWRDKTVISDAR